MSNFESPFFRDLEKVSTQILLVFGIFIIGFLLFVLPLTMTICGKNFCETTEMTFAQYVITYIGIMFQ